MVKVEIFEIEVLFCAYVCVASYILMVEKGYKKGLFFMNIWGIERSGFFNGREKWAKGFENQRV